MCAKLGSMVPAASIIKVHPRTGVGRSPDPTYFPDDGQLGSLAEELWFRIADNPGIEDGAARGVGAPWLLAGRAVG